MQKSAIDHPAHLKYRFIAQCRIQVMENGSKEMVYAGGQFIHGEEYVREFENFVPFSQPSVRIAHYIGLFVPMDVAGGKMS